MEIVSFLIDFVLHVDVHLRGFVEAYGTWVYALLFLIIFVETGLVVMPFLPGDSLPFVVGTLAGVGMMNYPLVMALLIVAAVAGDQLNYTIARFVGPAVVQWEHSRWFNKKAFNQAHAFYEKYGGVTIVLARFLPFLRTFAPFVAGVAEMTRSKFTMFEELFDVALTLSKCPLPAGNRLAVLTNAGGPAILATDAAVSSGLAMAPLLPATRSAIRRQLVPEASILNPIDMVAGAGAKDYDRCLRLLLKDPTVDMVLVIFVPPLTRDPIVVARAVFDAAKCARKPVVCWFMSREEVLRGIRKAAVEDWVPIYLYPESAVRALTALDERRRILARPEGTIRRYRAPRVKLDPGCLGVDARREL